MSTKFDLDTLNLNDPITFYVNVSAGHDFLFDGLSHTSVNGFGFSINTVDH